MTTELLCKDVVFHFNKKHLEDSSIPMWVVKTQGKTYYVNHVECTVPWSTKETPSNSHTKGAIKIKKVKLIIDHNNTATLLPLSSDEIKNLKQGKKFRARLQISGSMIEKIKLYIEDQQIKHGKYVPVSGGCGSTFEITEIYSKEDLTLLSLAWHNGFRVLQENEMYFKQYDTVNVINYDEMEEYLDDQVNLYES
jgi:hypothetical protein